ncbi:MAG TPA: PRC-barrel domain-containing protein, partial [Mycobacteriales bacterium]
MTEFDVKTLTGSTVVDSSGGKIGKVGQVYLDDQTGQPQWVTVRTGLFGTKESFVPLSAARLEGDRLIVDATKDQVSGAPRVDEDGHISEQEETELYRYYGLSGTGTGRTGTYETTDRTTGYDRTDRTAGYDRSAGHDTSGPNTDDAMTRSEERLVAGTQQTEVGKARLRKYVVTDTE